MVTLKTSSKTTSDVLVLGFSAKGGKLSIHPNISHIPEIADDTKRLLAILSDLGATGSVDEIIKVPYSEPRLIVFTGFGATAISYSHETLRLSLYGTMRPEKYSELDATLSKPRAVRKRGK